MAFYTAAPALDARWWKLLKSSGMNRWGCQRAGVLNSHAALAGWVPSSLLLLIIFEDRDGPMRRHSTSAGPSLALAAQIY